MQLTKLTVIALLSVVALACSQDSTAAKPKAAPTAAKPTAASAVPAEATQTAAAAASAAPAANHNCEGAKKHEGSDCGNMAKGDGAGCNQWDDDAMAVTHRDVPEGALWESFEVDGMTCGGCERRIQAKVGEIEGVVAVEASAELGKVRVAVAPDAKPSHGLAKARIAELGYKVR